MYMMKYVQQKQQQQQQQHLCLTIMLHPSMTGLIGSMIGLIGSMIMLIMLSRVKSAETELSTEVLKLAFGV